MRICGFCFDSDLMNGKKFGKANTKAKRYFNCDICKDCENKSMIIYIDDMKKKEDFEKYGIKTQGRGGRKVGGGNRGG